ncbi:hypothetical protein N9H39_11295 [Gammaproteobacteria bacterium]|jgi:hypothetical protein|nr:hypothetical protein [Gammaproteobacteria bacterium]
MNVILRSLLSVIITLALALPGLASADKGGHGHYKHGYKQKYGNRYPGGYVYPNQHITNYYKRDNSNEKLLIGLLVGGIAGYAISNAQKKHTDGHPNNRYPSAQPAASYPAGGHQYSHNTCLQEREYQTTVLVGGRDVPAYGTACLQPDGSWRHGQAQASY